MRSFCVHIERKPYVTTFTVESLEGPVVEMFAMDSSPAAIVHLEAEDEVDAVQKAWNKVLQIGASVLSADHEARLKTVKEEG